MKVDVEEMNYWYMDKLRYDEFEPYGFPKIENI